MTDLRKLIIALTAGLVVGAVGSLGIYHLFRKNPSKMEKIERKIPIKKIQYHIINGRKAYLSMNENELNCSQRI